MWVAKWAQLSGSEALWSTIQRLKSSCLLLAFFEGQRWADIFNIFIHGLNNVEEDISCWSDLTQNLENSRHAAEQSWHSEGAPTSCRKELTKTSASSTQGNTSASSSQGNTKCCTWHRTPQGTCCSSRSIHTVLSETRFGFWGILCWARTQWSLWASSASGHAIIFMLSICGGWWPTGLVPAW